MWRRLVDFLASPFRPKRELARLDDVVASNLVAQEEAIQAGEDAAETAVQARRKTVLSRRKAKHASRKLRDTSMQTGGVRDLVEDMMRDLESRH